jgi:hypothetical protein
VRGVAAGFEGLDLAGGTRDCFGSQIDAEVGFGGQFPRAPLVLASRADETHGVNEAGARVAMGAPVACSSATPSCWLPDWSPHISECIKKSAPAPTAPMLNNDASIAFVEIAPGCAAIRALRGVDASSNPFIGWGSGVQGLPPGLGIIQLCSTGWFTILCTFDARVDMDRNPGLV